MKNYINFFITKKKKKHFKTNVYLLIRKNNVRRLNITDTIIQKYFILNTDTNNDGEISSIWNFKSNYRTQIQ